MRRVLIAAQPNGTVQDRYGNARRDSTQFTDADGVPVPTWNAKTGGTSNTDPITPDDRGRLMRYIEVGRYLQVVGTDPPLDFEAGAWIDPPRLLAGTDVPDLGDLLEGDTYFVVDGDGQVIDAWAKTSE